MMQENYRQQFEKIKREYFSIGKVQCPILGNAFVYFNQSGFRHFLGRGRLLRPIADQLRRFHLMKHVKRVIGSTNTKVIETRVHGKSCFWALFNELDQDRKIKVVVRQTESGIIHFVSIMDL